MPAGEEETGGVPRRPTTRLFGGESNGTLRGESFENFYPINGSCYGDFIATTFRLVRGLHRALMMNFRVES